MNHRKTILLVEDNVLDAELAMESLKMPNVFSKIIHMKDGEEALNYLYSKGEFEGRSNPLPNLILLDLKMPRVSGQEVLATIKGDKNLWAIPVIMLTSSREESDLKKCYELGVNAYMVKPVDFQKFSNGIHAFSEFWGVFNVTPNLR